MRYAAIAALMASLCLTAGAGFPQEITEPTVPGEAAKTVTRHEAPAVEVVFVLDTTGSMGSLIQGAKDTIWAIANQLTMTDPQPQIRLGLVGYRDRGDAYVTQRIDLTDDLDLIYKNLMEYRAEGGGDTPESVNQALHEAITRFDWSTDAATYRVIFLVGDAPPHMDYENDVAYMDSCRMAAERDIVVNSIQCGGISGTREIWGDIAARAEGRYFQVPQTGGVQTIESPYDEELARLSMEMDGTVLYYGSAEVQSANVSRKQAGIALMAESSSYAASERAMFQASDAGARNFAGTNELVGDLAEGRVKLDDLEEAQLPEDLRGKTREEQEALIAAKAAEREKARERIRELSKKRQEFIDEKRATELADGGSSFDRAVFQAIQEQAAERGIIYTATPHE